MGCWAGLGWAGRAGGQACKRQARRGAAGWGHPHPSGSHHQGQRKRGRTPAVQDQEPGNEVLSDTECHTWGNMLLCSCAAAPTTRAAAASLGTTECVPPAPLAGS